MSFIYSIFIVLFLSNVQFFCSEISYPKIHVFIHVCTLGRWKEILSEELHRIKNSGLYDACQTISLGVLGQEDVTSFIQQYPKLRVLFQLDAIKYFERPTLLALWRQCIVDSDSVVLYMHTKGVTHKGSLCIEDWRKLLEYFCIDRWRDCVTALFISGYNMCGANWHLKPYPHFSGNFWWASGLYIASLPEYIGPAYLDPEMWAGQNSPRVLCFHESGVDHYFERYPESKYFIQPTLKEK